MVFSDWGERLEASQSDVEVVQVTRDFLATLDSFEIAVLPTTCRTPKLNSASEVSAYAFDLLAHEISPDDPATKVINKLAIFFAQAANRLARIYAPKRRVSDEELGLVKPRR